MFHIRLFKRADTPAMITLFQRSIREVASDHYTPEQIKVWAPDVIEGEGFSVMQEQQVERGGQVLVNFKMVKLL